MGAEFTKPTVVPSTSNTAQAPQTECAIDGTFATAPLPAFPSIENGADFSKTAVCSDSKSRSEPAQAALVFKTPTKLESEVLNVFFQNKDTGPLGVSQIHTLHLEQSLAMRRTPASPLKISRAVKSLIQNGLLESIDQLIRNGSWGSSTEPSTRVSGSPFKKYFPTIAQEQLEQSLAGLPITGSKQHHPPVLLPGRYR